MFYQTMPRKGYEDCVFDESKGFFVEGRNCDDCLAQLKDWCEEHKEKWVYFYDCGLAPAKSIPVARNIFEVYFYDAEPAARPWRTVCVQKGCDGKQEIDAMTEEEKSEFRSKRMSFFAAMASCVTGIN